MNGKGGFGKVWISFPQSLIHLPAGNTMAIIDPPMQRIDSNADLARVIAGEGREPAGEHLDEVKRVRP